ncbi:MAG: hypothetical protein ABFD62_14415 [Syntrophaceae bacterium]
MLRGIDVKQVFLQTNSVEKVQQTQQQHPDMQQRYLEIQIGEEKKIQKENVNYSEETEKARIGQKKEEEKRKGAQKGEQKQNPDEGETPGGQSREEDIRDKREGRSGVIHIDIKV